MRILLCTLLSFASVAAFAGSAITLSPGTSATINASDATLVTCEGASATKDYFCECDDNVTEVHLERTDFANGEKSYSTLRIYKTMVECEDVLFNNRHPACR